MRRSVNINGIAFIYYKVYIYISLEAQDTSCIGSFVVVFDASLSCTLLYKLWHLRSVKCAFGSFLCCAYRHTLKP